MFNGILMAENNISCYKVMLKYEGIIAESCMKEPLTEVDEAYARRLIDTMEEKCFRELLPE